VTAECEQIAEAVRAGATIDEAARVAGANVHSVRRWLTAGRRGDAKHAEFARKVDEARSERREAERALDGAVTLAEADGVLAAAVRRGSIPALKLWYDRHDRHAQPAEDEFSWLDPT
jgi:tellurite resistance protein